MNNINILEVVKIAKKAGKAILEIYSGDINGFGIEQKESKSFKEGTSPLTIADKIANKIIVEELNKLTNYPILSEEGKEIPYEVRKDWKSFWMIDPLDGTKEFIKKNGEFTVNIALINEGNSVLGVVYVPVKDVCYYTDGSTSFKDGEEIKTNKNSNSKLIVVASKSHFTDETKDYVESLGKEYEIVSIGSSLKICLVAEGKADIYPRLGPTMEWDTAAAHAIVKYTGKNIFKYDSEDEMTYNKENLLNPWFVVK